MELSPPKKFRRFAAIFLDCKVYYKGEIYIKRRRRRKFSHIRHHLLSFPLQNSLEISKFYQKIHINPRNIYGFFLAGPRILPIYMEVPYNYIEKNTLHWKYLEVINQFLHQTKNILVKLTAMFQPVHRPTF